MNSRFALAWCALSASLWAAGCGGGGGGKDVLGGPGPPEFMAGTIDGASYRATRVASRVSAAGTKGLLVAFHGLEDPSGRMFSFDLEFPDGIPRAGTWRLAPGTTKSVHTSSIPTANRSCYAWWDSFITVTRIDSLRAEGTFYIEAECTGSQFPPIEFFVRDGSFGLCMTAECQAGGWRDAD